MEGHRHRHTDGGGMNKAVIALAANQVWRQAVEM